MVVASGLRCERQAAAAAARALYEAAVQAVAASSGGGRSARRGRSTSEHAVAALGRRHGQFFIFFIRSVLLVKAWTAFEN